MSVSKTDMASGSRPLGSDLAKVDAYENTASDYVKFPRSRPRNSPAQGSTETASRYVMDG